MHGAENDKRLETVPTDIRAKVVLAALVGHMPGRTGAAV